MSNVEIRNASTDLEIRETEEGGSTITGYAVKWEQLSQAMGFFTRFKEKFQKGAFVESLEKDDQRALWNHNRDIVLGRTSNSTLRLEEDDTGLRFEVDLPETSWGNDIYASVKRGDVSGVSFGFKMVGEEWDDNDESAVTRTVTKAKLYEISPTAFPAYEQTEVQARNLADRYSEYRQANEETEEPPAEDQPKDTKQTAWIRGLRKKLNS